MKRTTALRLTRIGRLVLCVAIAVVTTELSHRIGASYPLAAWIGVSIAVILSLLVPGGGSIWRED